MRSSKRNSSKKINIEQIFIIHDILSELKLVLNLQSKRFGIELLNDNAEIVIGYMDAYDILFEDKKDRNMSEKTISMFNRLYKNILINLRIYVLDIVSFKKDIDKFMTDYAISTQYLHNKLLKIMY